MAQQQKKKAVESGHDSTASEKNGTSSQEAERMLGVNDDSGKKFVADKLATAATTRRAEDCEALR